MKNFIIMSILAIVIAFTYFNAGKNVSYPTDGSCFRQHADGNMTDNSGNVIVAYKNGDILCTRFIDKTKAIYYIAK